jgi:hypothetical protein
MFFNNRRFTVIFLCLMLTLITGLMLICSIVTKPLVIDGDGMYPMSSSVQLTNQWIDQMIDNTMTAFASKSVTTSSQSQQ